MGCGDRVGDQLVLVAVEAGQRVDNCLLDSVTVQPARVARAGS
jgi:hypothetical protein